MLNKKLLRKTMAFIEKHPKKHDQRVWCGTAQCFAGWACHLSGYRPLSRHERDALYNSEADSDFPIEHTVVSDETMGEVEEVAISLLGLTPDQAFNLFEPNNSRADLRQMVDELCKLPDVP